MNVANAGTCSCNCSKPFFKLFVHGTISTQMVCRGEERRGYKPLSLTEILAFTYCMDLKLEIVVVALN